MEGKQSYPSTPYLSQLGTPYLSTPSTYTPDSSHCVSNDRGDRGPCSDLNHPNPWHTEARNMLTSCEGFVSDIDLPTVSPPQTLELINKVMRGHEEIRGLIRSVSSLCGDIQKTVSQIITKTEGQDTPGSSTVAKRQRSPRRQEGVSRQSRCSEDGGTVKKRKTQNVSKSGPIQVLTIPQSGVTGVSWYGGIGNNNYWVAQWHEAKRQRKALFPTGKQTPEEPLGVQYAEALRAAIRRRRQMVRTLQLRCRARQESFPPLSTVECFTPPLWIRPYLKDQEEYVVACVVEFLAEPDVYSDRESTHPGRLASSSDDVIQLSSNLCSLTSEQIMSILIELLSRGLLKAVLLPASDPLPIPAPSSFALVPNPMRPGRPQKGERRNVQGRTPERTFEIQGIPSTLYFSPHLPLNLPEQVESGTSCLPLLPPLSSPPCTLPLHGPTAHGSTSPLSLTTHHVPMNSI